jgi:RNA polymerase sigma-70 factor, ECF subfamily
MGLAKGEPMPPASPCLAALSTPPAGPRLRVIEGGRVFREQLAATAAGLWPRALRLTRNPDRARDLIQDTCVRALRFETSFTPGTHFRAWLQQVLYSVFVSQCRRDKRARQLSQIWAADPSALGLEATEPAHPALLPGLARELAALPQVFAHTLRLVDLEDCSYQEAALRLGVPVGTVMSRLHRARRLLGERLAPLAA